MAEKKSGIREDVSIEEFNKNLPPRTSRMKMLKAWEKIKDVLDFFEITHSSHSKGGSGSGRHNAYVPPPQQPSASSFRQEHRFDPERAYIERMQERAYYQMVDGKGDPKHCDCDHDER